MKGKKGPSGPGPFGSWLGQGKSNERHRLQCAMSLFNMKINKDHEWGKYRTTGRLQGKLWLPGESRSNLKQRCGLRLEKGYDKYDEDENEDT